MLQTFHSAFFSCVEIAYNILCDKTVKLAEQVLRLFQIIFLSQCKRL